MAEVDAEVILGGVPIRLHSGPPAQEYSPLGGSATRRRSGGTAVKMQHWSKTAISIRGSGWLGLGFAQLDFTQPLELRCTQPLALTTQSLTGALEGRVRDDVAPWALAYAREEWVSTAVALGDDGRSFTLQPVAGALGYQVLWMPVFTVFCEPPSQALDPGGGVYEWTLTAEEV